MSSIIDKRFSTPTQSFDNKKRFIKRKHKELKGAVEEYMKESDMEDVMDGSPLTITVDTDDEPIFAHDNTTGKRKKVFAGNDVAAKGSKIGKRRRRDGGGGQAQLELTDTEFLEILFNNCELPQFLKSGKKEVVEYMLERYGYSKYGCPSRLSLVRSYKESLLRRIALKAALLRAIEEADDEEEIEILQKRLKHLPFFEENDLRYHYRTLRAKPSKSGVMFMVMDTSGSVSDEMRHRGKLFFYLIYRFLMSKYDKVKVIPILHTDEAEVVDINRFFKQDWNGSTLFVPVYELVKKLLETDIDSESTNVYLCHLSDSDLFTSDFRAVLPLIKEVVPQLSLGIYGHLDSPERFDSMIESGLKESGLRTTILAEDDKIVDAFLEIFKKK